MMASLMFSSMGIALTGVLSSLAVVPSRVMLMGALFALVTCTEAVTCFTCHDGVPGCAGGAACPFYQTPMINSEILSNLAEVRDETSSGFVAAQFSDL